MSSQPLVSQLAEQRRRQIEAAQAPGGGWTKEQLAAWGVPWPPPKGWKEKLIVGQPIALNGDPALSARYWARHPNGQYVEDADDLAHEVGKRSAHALVVSGRIAPLTVPAKCVSCSQPYTVQVTTRNHLEWIEKLPRWGKCAPCLQREEAERSQRQEPSR